MAQESFLSAARKSRADFLIMHADLAVLPRVTPDEFNEQENAPPSLAPSVRLERTNSKVCVNTDPSDIRRMRSRTSRLRVKNCSSTFFKIRLPPLHENA